MNKILRVPQKSRRYPKL